MEPGVIDIKLATFDLGAEIGIAISLSNGKRIAYRISLEMVKKLASTVNSFIVSQNTYKEKWSCPDCSFIESR